MLEYGCCLTECGIIYRLKFLPHTNNSVSRIYLFFSLSLSPPPHPLFPCTYLSAHIYLGFNWCISSLALFICFFPSPRWPVSCVALSVCQLSRRLIVTASSPDEALLHEHILPFIILLSSFCVPFIYVSVIFLCSSPVEKSDRSVTKQKWRSAIVLLWAQRAPMNKCHATLPCKCSHKTPWQQNPNNHFSFLWNSIQEEG